MSFEVGRLSAALTLEGMSEFSRGMDDTKVKFDAATASAKGTTQAADGMAAGIRKAATQNTSELNLVGGAFTKVGIAAAAASGVALTKWANFDQAMSNVSAATHESAENMKLLEAAALEAGARTVFSATEAANAVEELAKAGVSTADILSGGLDGALDLAAAGGLGVADAAGIAATALKTFKLEGADMAHVADLLAAGAGKAMGDVTDLSAALNQSAMVANATGLSIEETTAGLAAFASQGLLGSDAGTSFKSMLQSLTPTSGKAAETMKQLGISAYDSQGNFIGLAEFAGNLKESLAGLSVEQQQAALKTIFGSDAIRAATVLYSEGAEGIREWESAVNDQGYAADTAADRLDNLKGDLEALGGALDTAFIQTGSGANDALRDMVQLVTSAVDAYNDLPAPVQSAVIGVGLLTAGVGLLGGAFLIGLPKVAEFKTALSTLGVTAGSTSAALSGVGKFLTGPWGIALMAAASVAAVLVGEKQKMVTNSKELAETLDAESGAVTENSSAWAANKLEQEGILAMAERLGISSKDMTDAWLGNADALDTVNDRLALFTDNADFRMDNTDWKGWSNDLATVQGTLEGSNEMLTAAKEKHDRLKEATDGSGNAAADAAGKTETQVDALEQLAGVAQSTSEDVSELANQIKNFGSSSFDVEESAIKLRDEFRELQKAAEEGWMVLDDSEKGDDTKQALLDVASAANESAGAVMAMTGDQEKANAILDSARQRIVDMRVALGESPEAAAAWAEQFVSSSDAVNSAVQQILDKVNEIPEEKKLWVDADTAAAYEGLEGVEVIRIDDKTVVVVGENEDAMTRINEVAAADPPDKVFEIAADAADAYAGIDGVNIRKVDEKTAYVWGENADAVKKIEDVNSKQTPRKVVTIDGDATNFESVWSTLTGRVGEAWVNIFGKKNDFAGGMYSAANFAAGGFVSGMYNGVVGGIQKMGVDGIPHTFAEKHMGVPWETYISGHPSYRERNIGLALDTLTRLAFPVIPASALGGIPAFAAGGTVGRPATPTLSTPAKQTPVARRADGPLVGNLYLGGGATKSEFDELERRLDFIRRGGR